MATTVKYDGNTLGSAFYTFNNFIIIIFYIIIPYLIIYSILRYSAIKRIRQHINSERSGHPRHQSCAHLSHETSHDTEHNLGASFQKAASFLVRLTQKVAKV